MLGHNYKLLEFLKDFNLYITTYLCSYLLYSYDKDVNMHYEVHKFSEIQKETLLVNNGISLENHVCLRTYVQHISA